MITSLTKNMSFAFFFKFAVTTRKKWKQVDLH